MAPFVTLIPKVIVDVPAEKLLKIGWLPAPRGAFRPPPPNPPVFLFLLLPGAELLQESLPALHLLQPHPCVTFS